MTLEIEPNELPENVAVAHLEKNIHGLVVWNTILTAVVAMMVTGLMLRMIFGYMALQNQRAIGQVALSVAAFANSMAEVESLANQARVALQELGAGPPSEHESEGDEDADEGVGDDPGVGPAGEERQPADPGLPEGPVEEEEPSKISVTTALAMMELKDASASMCLAAEEM